MKKHRASVKGETITKDKALEERRRRSTALGNERRDALLRSKRLKRGFEQDEPADSQIAKLDIATLEVAVRKSVEEARASQGTGGQKHLENVRYIRKLLTESQESPVQQVLDAGVIPVLASSMQATAGSAETRATVMESVWALAYLAGGAHKVAEAVLPLTGLLILHLSGQQGWHVAEVCAWALGNLAADCDEFSDTIVAQGGVKPLAQLVLHFQEGNWGEASQVVVMAGVTAAWALSNLVRNSNVAGDHLMGLPSSTERLIALLGYQHLKFTSELLWLIVYLIAKNTRNLEHMVEGGLGPPLVKVMAGAVHGLQQDVSNAMMVLIPALRSLGNVISGARVEYITQILNSEGGAVIPCLVECLRSTHRGILKEAAWALSNIAGCPDRSGAEVIVKSGVVPILLDLIHTAAFDVRKEAAFVLANLCMQTDDEPNVDFLQQLLQSPKFLDTFMQFMRSPDMEAAGLAVQFTEMVLRVIPGGPEMIEQVDGIDALEAVQYGKHPPDMQKMAAHLVDKYFGEGYGEV